MRTRLGHNTRRWLNMKFLFHNKTLSVRSWNHNNVTPLSMFTKLLDATCKDHTAPYLSVMITIRVPHSYDGRRAGQAW